MRKLLAAASLALLVATGGAYAQAPAPTTTAPTTTAPTTPAPATNAPLTPAPTTPAARPSTRPSTRATIPAGTKVNLNTATAAQLDALPGIGKARLKVIMTERAKSPFKDWSDFDQRTQHTSINAGVKQKIKDSVVF